MKFNPKYINNDKYLIGLIIHEIQHVFSKLKGQNIKDEYTIAQNMKRYCYINGNMLFPYTYTLMDMIYYSSPTEIYAHVHEIWSDIFFSKIKTKEAFINYLTNNNMYQYTINLGKYNIYKLWDDIKYEEMDKNIIEKFEVENIDKWLKYLDKQFKKSGASYTYRFNRLLDKLPK